MTSSICDVIKMTVDSMAAVAILTCQPSSHPFNERQIGLQEPVKIGRSVARARPAPNNAIFDCKVLSRNHAMIWYENAKFYLQDTKSSNGTFVNHQRLSKGSEESPPREVFSGDIIQFGVDVMENSRRVTHGCIIATITLYHPDGSEAKPDYSATMSTNGCLPTLGAHSQELYQLSQYLQEALHREQMLENKLVNLQRLVENTQESSESGWQALIDEDRLLSRLEVLESQLHAYAKNQTEENLRTELVALQEDKHNYETTAKESLRRILEEKLEAVRKHAELEQNLTNAEDECTHLKQMFDMSKRELETLTVAHQETTQEVADSREKLKEALETYEKELENVKGEKMEVEAKLNVIVALDEDLAAEKKETAEGKDTEEESPQKDKDDVSDEAMEGVEETSGLAKSMVDSQEVQVDLVDTDKLESVSELEGELSDAQKQIRVYEAQIDEATRRLEDSQEKVKQLQKELKTVNADTVTNMSESAEADNDTNTDLACKLRLQLEDIEKQLSQYEEESTNVTIIATNTTDDRNSNPIVTNNETRTVESILTITRQSRIDELLRMKQVLSDVRHVHQASEADVTKYKHFLEETQIKTNLQVESNRKVESRLADALRLGAEKEEAVVKLKDKLTKANVCVHETEVQIKQVQSQLVEAQQTLKHSRNEAHQLKAKVDELSDELIKEGYVDTGTDVSTTGKSSEFSTLRQECDHLRLRILKIESDMRKSKQENLQLSADYNRLQESYQHLELLKARLELEQSQDNMTDSQKEADQVKQTQPDSDTESSSVQDLTTRVTSCTDEIRNLESELSDMSTEYVLLAEKTRHLSMCAMLPIIVLIFALIIAFHPTLSSITATTTAPD